MTPLTRDEIRRAITEATFISPATWWGRIERDESANITGMICPAGHLCMQRGIQFISVAGRLYPEPERIDEADAIMNAFVDFCIKVGAMRADDREHFWWRQTPILDKLQRKLNPKEETTP